jgi:DNA polymerase III epsilon subunit-like protein
MILDSVEWVVVDTETTGPDPGKDKPVEIAAIKFRGTQEVARWTTLVDPEQTIPPESSSIHHLTNNDIVGAPTVGQALDKLARFIEGAGMLVAHNVEFDRQFLTTINEPTLQPAGTIDWDWLCTYRLARHLLPAAPNYRLSTLRYLRDLNVPRNVSVHRALGDAIVAAELAIDLVHLYENTVDSDSDLDELLEYARSYIRVPSWPFGRYFGQPIADAPTDYVRWVLANHARAQQDYDLRSTLEAIVRRNTRPALAS